MTVPNDVNRRTFLRSAAAVAAAGLACRSDAATVDRGPTGNAQQEAAGGGSSNGGPVVVASANGLGAVSKALGMIRDGADPLDAVVAGVNLVELDPKDHSVGYGGLPNEDGVVELDSSVMHGPTHRAGAVAALRHIKTPSKVAKLVLERTDHVLLVGAGALRFAKAHGFKEEELLTDDARKIWLHWKEARPADDWLPPEVPDDDERQSSRHGELMRTPEGYLFTYGTINCCGLNAKGDLAGVTTTSGLSYKIPGRVGDSPIIGAGLFVDNAAGAAGATGRGEAVIINAGSAMVVEFMRQGRTPTEACLEALRRIAKNNMAKRLRRKDGRPNFDVKFYAVRKDGLYGSASIWSGAKFSVATRDGARHEACAHLYERPK